MAYIPKSKLQLLETEGGVFVIKGTDQFYVGNYIETSTGKYYAGSDIYDHSTELLKKPITSNRFGTNPETNIYNYLKKGKKKFIENLKEITSTKLIPTPEDYENLKYTRYFAKKINSIFGYIEIDNDTYNDLKARKSKSYDYNMYGCGKIEWALIGDTKTINQNTLNLKEVDFPGISYLFQVKDEFKSLEPLPTSLSKNKHYDPYKGKQF